MNSLFNALLKRIRENDPSLSTDNIGCIRIGDQGAQALQTNSTLKIITLNFNKIGHQGA